MPKDMDHREFDSLAVLAIEFPNIALLETGGEGYSTMEIQSAEVASLTLTHGGTIVKSLGESFTISFPSSIQALRCAFELTNAIEKNRKKSNGTEYLRSRMGLHIGKAHSLGKDLLGEAVDGALSLRAVASPGTICASAEIVAQTLDSQLFSSSPLTGQRQKVLSPGLIGYILTPFSEETKSFKNHENPSPLKEIKSAPEADKVSLDGIRKSILEEIRESGRRMSVQDAMRKYGWYGIEATEVIAGLAEAGILTGKNSYSSFASTPSAPDQGSRINTNSNFNTNDIGKSIETAIHAIVAEIEQSVQSGIKESRHPRHNERKRQDLKNEIRKRVSKDSFERYKSELISAANKAGKGIVGNIISFFLINPVLWYINIEYAKPFPWAPLVSLFWGFGLLDSILGSIRTKKHAREVEVLPDLDEAQTRELKNLNKERNSIGKHFVSALSIPSALLFINIATNADNPWFIIPSAIMVATFLIHAGTYFSSVPRKIRNFFESAGLGRGRKGMAEAQKRQKSATQDLGAYTNLYRDAWNTAMDIQSDLLADDKKAAEEMKPSIDAYLGQVLLLAKTANELDAIIGEIPMQALEADKDALRVKWTKSQDSLKPEYEKSIREIEKQEESFKGLKEQREVIDLRLRSSVNQLNQLKMDLARARAADTETDVSRGESAISSIRERSLELSHYIEDLRNGQLEALADPFAELERKYGSVEAFSHAQDSLVKEK